MIYWKDPVGRNGGGSFSLERVSKSDVIGWVPDGLALSIDGLIKGDESVGVQEVQILLCSKSC